MSQPCRSGAVCGRQVAEALVAEQSEPDRLAEIRQRLNTFVRDRDWEQFQSPKNLVMALTGELGELAEHFQWLTSEQSRALDEDRLNEVCDEVADVQIYVLLLTERLGIDLLDAVERKIDKNEQKYPVELAHGNARKYTDL
ncbi:nucleotide pyrophosphohydrolase [Ectothiorhodospiraceae bacterium WFHF3C12]|nr:nucleotide pyrophosphohydrolase [Ectothiorhodospiraceae bacterium WFHF3C12]